MYEYYSLDNELVGGLDLNKHNNTGTFYARIEWIVGIIERGE